MSITVITGATVIGFSPGSVSENTDIVIQGEDITAVGKGAASSVQADNVIDATGKIVHPGMVCAHHHYYSGLSRGITANIPPSPDFISTLKHLWWRVDRALDEQSIYYSSMICSLDAIRCGTTSVLDHHASPAYIKGSLNQIKRGFEETGLRGMTCYEVTNRNGGEQETREGIQENIEFASQIDKEDDDLYAPHLVQAAIGGHAPFTISDAGMEQLADAIEQTGRGIHMHVGEGAYDTSISHHLYEKDLIRRLDDFGLLNKKGILVHGIHLSEADIELLNERDAFLVHNVRSNMNNNVGYNHRLPKVKNLALGTDGIGPDMFEELKVAFFKHRDAGGPWMPGAFLQALSNGNEILKRYFKRNFGQIAPGYAADLVISDYAAPTPMVPDNIAGHIAFGWSSNSVNTVIIDGKIVMENRQFPFDVQELYAKAAEEAQRVWNRVDQL
ncbi:MAG: putative aminohydrolase SsnA [Spirochaetota bacterium]